MTISVCFVSDTIHSYFGSGIETGTGGAERQQYLLANELQTRGYDVSVATLDHGVRKRKSVDSITVYTVIPDTRGLKYAPYKALKLLFWLQKIDADLYYVRGNDFLCVVTAAYTRMSNSKFLYVVANDANVEPRHLERQGILRHPYIWGMNTADIVVAQTDHQRKVLENEHGIDAVRIPNGYDLPPKSDITPHEERNYVLWVGSMDPHQKKPSRFLELARQLPDIEFRMIGPRDNDHPNYHDEILAEARGIPNLEYLGYVHPDEIHDHFRNAMVLVNTSDYEGFPNVFLEAWRYQTPVVSLFHTLDDILSSEPVGIHAGSMEELVSSVEHLTSNQTLRATMGAEGHQYLKDNFSIDRMVDRYENVFDKTTR